MRKWLFCTLLLSALSSHSQTLEIKKPDGAILLPKVIQELSGNDFYIKPIRFKTRKIIVPFLGLYSNNISSNNLEHFLRIGEANGQYYMFTIHKLSSGELVSQQKGKPLSSVNVGALNKRLYGEQNIDSNSTQCVTNAYEIMCLQTNKTTGDMNYYRPVMPFRTEVEGPLKHLYPVWVKLKQ